VSATCWIDEKLTEAAYALEMSSFAGGGVVDGKSFYELTIHPEELLEVVPLAHLGHLVTLMEPNALVLVH
jgi:hypothetical protein